MRQADLEALRIDRGPRRRQARGGRLRAVLGLVALIIFGGLALLFQGPILEFIDRWRLPAVRALVVTATSPAELEAVKGLSANGYVVAGRRAALSPDAPGRIVELKVREGRRVSQGQLVARLYDAPAKAALSQAEAELAGARAREARARHALASQQAELVRLTADITAAAAALAGGESSLDMARKDFERSEKLKASGAIGGQDFDRAGSTLRRAEAELARLRALQAGTEAARAAATARLVVARSDIAVAETEEDLAEARLEGARAALAKTEIRAPFPGIVVLKDAELGEVVSPNVQNGGSRGSILTLVDFASLEVQVDVPETNLASVVVGAAVRVFLDAFPAEPYSGRVDRIWPTANRQKATIEVRISILDPDDRLRPEMGARVVFIDPDSAEAFGPAPRLGEGQEPPKPKIFIPESALVTASSSTLSTSSPSTSSPSTASPSTASPSQASGHGVFVLERDRVRLAPVSIGERRGDRVLIKAGLEAGQRLVLDPPPRLADGDRVRLESRP